MPILYIDLNDDNLYSPDGACCVFNLEYPAVPQQDFDDSILDLLAALRSSKPKASQLATVMYNILAYARVNDIDIGETFAQFYDS